MTIILRAPCLNNAIKNLEGYIYICVCVCVFVCVYVYVCVCVYVVSLGEYCPLCMGVCGMDILSN